MSVYSLNNAYYLYEDIDNVLTEIGQLYEFSSKEGKKTFTSKTVVPSNIFWASDESADVFNKLIPKIKSLHKDMYHIIECVVRDKNGASFDAKNLEPNYPYLNLMRHFNNKIKHSTQREIDIIQQVTIGKGTQPLDILVQDIETRAVFPYSTFLCLFLQILEDQGVISITDK